MCALRVLVTDLQSENPSIFHPFCSFIFVSTSCVHYVHFGGRSLEQFQYQNGMNFEYELNNKYSVFSVYSVLERFVVFLWSKSRLIDCGIGSLGIGYGVRRIPLLYEIEESVQSDCG